MSFLASLSPNARAELDALIDARIEAALAVQAREPQPRWLNTRTAAEYLGCSARAVHQRIRRGRIPAGAVKHSGRSLLIDRLALDRAINRE